MPRQPWLYPVYLTFGGLLLLSCAILSTTPTPDLIATEVAVQKTAAALLTAEAPTAVPTETPAEVPMPSETPAPTSSSDIPAEPPELTVTPVDIPTPAIDPSETATPVEAQP